MPLSSPTTVVGIFDDHAQALEALRALKQAGFRDEQIGIASREWVRKLGEVRVDEQHAAEQGAATGAVVGATLGATIGLVGAVFLPGAIPLLAGHALLSALGGGLLGAGAGTFAGPFLAMGFSEADAHKNAQYVAQGKTVLLVHAPDRKEEARKILVEQGAYDESMEATP